MTKACINRRRAHGTLEAAEFRNQAPALCVPARDVYRCYAMNIDGNPLVCESSIGLLIRFMQLL